MQHVSRSLGLGLVGAVLAGMLAASPILSAVEQDHVTVQANGYDTSPGAVPPDNDPSPFASPADVPTPTQS